MLKGKFKFKENFVFDEDIVPTLFDGLSSVYTFYFKKDGVYELERISKAHWSYKGVAFRVPYKRFLKKIVEKVDDDAEVDLPVRKGGTEFEFTFVEGI